MTLVKLETAAFGKTGCALNVFEDKLPSLIGLFDVEAAEAALG